MVKSFSQPHAQAEGVQTLSTPDRLAYTYGEAARMIGISPRTLFSEVQAGRLNPTRIGRRRLIRLTELNRYMDAQSEPIQTITKGNLL